LEASGGEHLGKMLLVEEGSDRFRFGGLHLQGHLVSYHGPKDKRPVSRVTSCSSEVAYPCIFRERTPARVDDLAPAFLLREPSRRGVSRMKGARFRDRREAGRQLAEALARYAGQPGVLVLALPRGGVPVGYEVARVLQAPLDVMLVRKLGVPGHEELAMGAIASGGVRIVSNEVVSTLGIDEREIAAVAAAEEAELDRRERAYRNGRAAPDVRGRTVILVDDGLATGSTMRAAAAALRAQGTKRLVVAVPVAPPETCEAMRSEVDEVICAREPEPFLAVGVWYEDFSQTTDDEVRELLRRAAEGRGED
jgi:putative phosphoribosyl transferase